jgi:hypothetical protein
VKRREKKAKEKKIQTKGKREDDKVVKEKGKTKEQGREREVKERK